MQETKSIMDKIAPEASIIQDISKDNPIMGLVLNKLAPQLSGLMGDIKQGSNESQESFRKGL